MGAEIHPSMNSTVHCHEDAASLTRLITSAGFTVPEVMSTSTWPGTRLKLAPVTPGMACSTVFISASLLLHPDPLSVKGSRSLVGGVAETAERRVKLTKKNVVKKARWRQMCGME